MNLEALRNLESTYSGGTSCYHRYLPPLVLTDGTKGLAEAADCFWLMDIIASYQPIIRKRGGESLVHHQFWHLRKGPAPALHLMRLHSSAPLLEVTIVPKAMAHLVCARDTNENGTLDYAIVQEIEHTDFPFEVMEEATVWVAPGDERIMVAYLPCEH